MKNYVCLLILLGLMSFKPIFAQNLAYTVIKDRIGEQIAHEFIPFSNLHFDCLELSSHQVKVFWVTPPSYQSQYFLVEKSFDNKTYELLAKVPAKKQSDKDIVYFLVDPIKLTQNSYYRITEFKENGDKKSEEVLMVANEESDRSIAKMAYSKQDGKNIIQLSGKYDFRHTDVMLVSVPNSLGVVCELDSLKEGGLKLTSAYDLPAGEYMIKLREIRNTKRYKFTIAE